MPRTPAAGTPRTAVLSLKMTPREVTDTKGQAHLRGFTTHAAYLRYLVRQDRLRLKREGRI